MSQTHSQNYWMNVEKAIRINDQNIMFEVLFEVQEFKMVLDVLTKLCYMSNRNS